MSHRKIGARERRIAEYQELLVKLSRQHLPWRCHAPNEIEHLLALHSAALIVADFAPPVFASDGSRSIPCAVVNAVTPEGGPVVRRAALNSKRGMVSLRGGVPPTHEGEPLNRA